MERSLKQGKNQQWWEIMALSVDDKGVEIMVHGAAIYVHNKLLLPDLL